MVLASALAAKPSAARHAQFPPSLPGVFRCASAPRLSHGYTIPATLTKKAGIDQIRIYFSGENLCYWSPLKKNSKYVDPEAAINRSGVNNNAYYPWAKTFMFGIDITF